MKKTIIVGGAAGEGINTASRFIERIVKDEGLYFLSYRNYMSRVRGGYNYTTLVISDTPVKSIMPKADLFLALNKESVENAAALTVENGMIYSAVQIEEYSDKHRYYVVDRDKVKAILNKNVANMVGVGVAFAYIGFDKSVINRLVNAKWSEKVNGENLSAAMYGYDAYEGADTIVWQHHNAQSETMMITGNQAVAMGAIAAGISFYSAYPMSPSTGIMTYLSRYMKNVNLLVEQAEDEIAAVMSTIGAASNGVRAMTSTSGGGFSLMVEAVGFAAVAEVPIVICNVQRPGPATGLPTRTEQADLLFMLHASQGEFARIILAPSSVASCFHTAFRAFNLADKFQVPVMILTDQYLADSTQTVPLFNTDDLKIERYLQEEQDKAYHRYPLENYIGKRKYPGIDNCSLIMTDSHVHDLDGHVTEEIEMTVKLKEKLLNKEKLIFTDLNPPILTGGDDYIYLMIAWGSTVSVAESVVEQMRTRNVKISLLGFTDIYPIPETVLDPFVNKDTVIINVEGNATNQFGKLLRMTTGVKWHHAVNRFDGRPFTSDEIIKTLEGIIDDGE